MQHAMADFDSWLAGELGKGFAAVAARPVPAEPRYQAYRQAHPGRLPLRGLIASRRLALLAVPLFVGVTGAAAAAATGTDPLVLGQQMVAEVVTCKDQLASGQHGIGDCVSSFVQAQHEPSSSMRTGSATTTPLA